MESGHKKVLSTTRLRFTQRENTDPSRKMESSLESCKGKQRPSHRYLDSVLANKPTGASSKHRDVRFSRFQTSLCEPPSQFQYLATIKQSSTRWFRNKKPKLSSLQCLILQGYTLAPSVELRGLYHVKLHEMYECYLEIKKNIKSYQILQSNIGQLIKISQDLGSITIKFHVLFFAGKCMHAFGNCILAMNYFCKALKINATRKGLHSNYQLKIQLKIYYITATIFLQKTWNKQAKLFAFKYLRKCWLYQMVEEELVGYDLLGMVYFYENNMSLAQYFHQRMCEGIVESPDVTNIFANQVNKQVPTALESGILEFTSGQKVLASNIQDFYKGQITTDQKYHKKQSYNRLTGRYVQEKVNRLMIPHLSLNRCLNNHHRIEKKTFQKDDEVSAKEFFYLRPSLQTKLTKQALTIIQGIKNCLWHLNQSSDFSKA